MKKEEITKTVRARYANVAKQSGSCNCAGPATARSAACCGPATADVARNVSKAIGYTDSDMSSVPEGANLGLGCGNPIALASLKEGEVVLDLGSGAGFDCFLAAPRVGPKGKVIGVDMTPEMLDKARENARKSSYKNVEFRLGEIENLPVSDSSVDVIISNCVINLSVDKKRVFQEAYRVTKPGGRLMVSDIVVLKELPKSIKESIAAYTGCIAGAIEKTAYLDAIKAAGFGEVKVLEEAAFPIDCIISDPTAKEIMDNIRITPEQVKDLAGSVVSVKVAATKPL